MDGGMIDGLINMIVAKESNMNSRGPSVPVMVQRAASSLSDRRRLPSTGNIVCYCDY